MALSRLMPVLPASGASVSGACELPGAMRGPPWRLAGLALVAVTVAAFAAGLAGEAVWDDKALIGANAHLQGGEGLASALTRGFWDVSSSGDAVASARYYRPVVTLAFWVQWQLFGANPVGYHAVSLALHLGCVLLALGWLRRRLAPAGVAGEWAALFAATLFALHPTRSEPVFWISGSTDLWMALWALLGLWAMQARAGTRAVLLAAPCFILAMLSKESGVALALLPVVEALLGPAEGRRRRLGRAAVVLLLVGAATAARLWAFPPGAGAADARGVGEVATRSLSALGLYLTRLFWPWPASVELGFDAVDERGAPLAHAGWLAVGVVACAALLLLSLAASRRARARSALCDAAFFAVPLAPVLQLLPLDTGVLGADRYLFFPLLGVAALLARGVSGALVRLGPARGPPSAALATGLLAAAGILCMQPRAEMFSSDASLWRHETRAQPDNARAALRYARVLRRTGELDLALEILRRAWNRGAVPPVLRAELALCAAGTVLRRTPDTEPATLRALSRFFEDAAGGGPADLAVGSERWQLAAQPGLADWLSDRMVDFVAPRALARARAGDVPAAEAALRAALARRPDSPTGWAHLALVLARGARWSEARAAVAEGLRRLPNDAQLRRLDARLAASQTQQP